MNPLDRLFAPRSIAVVGASDDPDKAGYQMMEALRDYPGELFPVNVHKDMIQGLRAYKSVGSIGKAVDVVILCVPAAVCPDIIRDAGEHHAGAIVITSGGFEESGPEGKALQNDIRSLCRRYDMRLLGPNTAGYVSPAEGVTASFNPLVRDFEPGNIAVVSQSGAMSLVLATAIQNLRLGVSIGVGTGNAADIGIPDIVEYLASHKATKAVAIYLEGVEDGRRLYDAVRKTSAVKPVVVFSVGRGDIGDFASSHTGKMIGSYEVKRTALEQAGAVVVASSVDLVTGANVLSRIRLPASENPGIGLLTGQAGPAMVIADYLRRRNVSIPKLEDESIRKIREILPLRTYIRNPVDTARPEQTSFQKILGIMAADPGIDLLVTYAMHEPMCVDPVTLLRKAAEQTRKPIVFGTSGLPNDVQPTVQSLESMDIPAYVSPDRTATAVWALVEDAKRAFGRQRAELRVKHTRPRITAVHGRPNEAEAKKILQRLGIPVPRGMVCDSRAEALAAYNELKPPCVAKILSSSVNHKSDVGGVHTGIRSKSRLKDALTAIDAISLTGERKYLIEEEAPPGLDVIIGGKRDASFGPVVMFGLGGTIAEAFGDVATRLAPLTIDDAFAMMNELRTGVLLDGWRGGPRYDKDAIARAILIISSVLAAHPEIQELDLNPVRVFPEGLLVLDALLLRR